MITVDEKTYPTISDAAKEFGVSPKAVGEWINKGIISRPPQIENGLRLVQIFPSDYMKKAKQEKKEYQDRQKQKQENPLASPKK